MCILLIRDWLSWLAACSLLPCLAPEQSSNQGCSVPRLPLHYSNTTAASPCLPQLKGVTFHNPSARGPSTNAEERRGENNHYYQQLAGALCTGSLITCLIHTHCFTQSFSFHFSHMHTHSNFPSYHAHKYTHMHPRQHSCTVVHNRHLL